MLIKSNYIDLINWRVNATQQRQFIINFKQNKSLFHTAKIIQWNIQRPAIIFYRHTNNHHQMVMIFLSTQRGVLVISLKNWQNCIKGTVKI